MDLKLKDKVIIVTGGAGLPGSIGETIVRHISEEGGIPVFVDKHPRGKELEQSICTNGKEEGVPVVDGKRREGKKTEQQAIKKKGGECLFVQADLTTAEGCQTAVQKTTDRFGRIDGLVNNLGINDGNGFGRSYDQFVDSLKLNLVHFFAVTKAALPWLKKSSGPIINIASKVALTGQGGTSGYAAAKGGVLALTREWALDLCEYNIRVNALVIAESWTPGYKEWIEKFDNPEAKLKSITSKIPLGQRMTKPSEIADTILFLLSKRASHITGQFIHVDGGYVHLDRAIS